MVDKSINSVKADHCYGCELCEYVCSTRAISIVSDEEGFLRPLVNSSLCLNCGKCIMLCPVDKHNVLKQENHNKKVFAVSLNNMDYLLKSSSGGAGYALMKAGIENGYRVFGVSYSTDYRSCHYSFSDNYRGISSFVGTKYIQATKKDIYKKLQESINEGKKVVFVGLPCEVAAVKSFLRNSSVNIIFVELICHGVTSPKVAEQYVEKMEKKKGEIKWMTIRGKKKGWTPGFLEILFKSGDSFSKIFDSTEYGFAFRNFSRPSCYCCEYKGDNRVGDITIGDYWGASENDSYWNKYGVSVVFVHSERGMSLFNSIKGAKITEITYDKAIRNNSLINKPRDVGIRAEYANTFIRGDIFTARKKNESIKGKMVRLLRNIYYVFR